MGIRLVLSALFQLLRAPLYPLWWLRRRRFRPRPWLRLRVRPRLAELPTKPPRWVRWLAPGRDRATSLTAIRRLGDEVSRDPDRRGLVLELPRLEAGWSKAAALRGILRDLREAGKAVVVYLPEGGGHRELYVASAATRVVVGREAVFAPLGLGIESRFFKPLLDRAGVAFEAVARKEYKGAAERFTRDGSSAPNREQLEALLRDHAATLHEALDERGPGGRRLLEGGLARAAELVDAGFADAEAHVDELPLHVEPDAGAVRWTGAGAYLRHREARFFRRLRRAPYLAVVPVKGVIVDQPVGGLFGGRGTVSFEGLAKHLRRLRQDPLVAGVLLEVDSPGGSAFASERLHREILRLREEKPVVAWFGDVAASGGYYVAMAADHVVASATTVTGSIGVISGKWVADRLLDGLGIRTETIQIHDQANLFSATRPLGDDGLAVLDRQADAFYDRFLEVVADGRGLPRERVEEVARGRVWSGRSAVDRGLVDALGGFEDAVEVLRGRADVPAGQRASLRPRRLTAREQLAAARGEPTPAPPPGSGLAAWLAGALSPELREAALLVEGRAPLLAWLPGAPRIE